MGYYDWEKIVANQTDSELKTIYADRSREPEDKVKAVILELQKRGVLSADETIIPRQKKLVVLRLEEVESTRPNKERAKIAGVFVLIVLLLDIASIFSSLSEYTLLAKIKNNDFYTTQMVVANDLRQSVLAVLHLVVFIGSAIAFIFWFRRAYYNLGQRVSFIKYEHGWASGSWFIPILNLFRPYQIMEELWKKINEIFKERVENRDVPKLRIGMLGIWWALWLGSNFLNNIITRLSLRAETVNEFIYASIGDIISSFIAIPLAIVTYFVIRNYAKKEEVLYNSEYSSRF